MKCLTISDTDTLNVFLTDGCPCVTSTEFSSLLWDGGDVVKYMLRRRCLNIDPKIITVANNEELFATLSRYSVKGVTDTNGILKSSLAVYKLADIKEAMTKFTPKLDTTKQLIEQEAKLWTENPSQFWKVSVKLVESDAVCERGLLHHYDALKVKRKQLYEKILRNKAESVTLVEIELIDRRLQSFGIK